MSLRALMAADLDRVFLNVNDFAEAVTFTPRKAVSSFACTIVINDPAPLVVGVVAGEEDRRLVSALASSAIVRAGIAAIETATGARDPRQGDAVTFGASSPYAGTWVVDRAQADLGGGCQLDLVFARHLALGAQGVREIR